jgi:hypothetical protein
MMSARWNVGDRLRAPAGDELAPHQLRDGGRGPHPGHAVALDEGLGDLAERVRLTGGLGLLLLGIGCALRGRDFPGIASALEVREMLRRLLARRGQRHAGICAEHHRDRLGLPLALHAPHDEEGDRPLRGDPHPEVAVVLRGVPDAQPLAFGRHERAARPDRLQQLVGDPGPHRGLRAGQRLAPKHAGPTLGHRKEDVY